MITSELNEKNVDLFKKKYELPHQWKLRKDFILAHKDKGYTIDRLICLSQLFINIETMGLGYEKEIMERNRDLGSIVGSLEEFRYQKEKDQEERERDQERDRKRKQSRQSTSCQNTPQHYRRYQRRFNT